MARVQVYLGFTDNCREAMQFYQQALGGDLTIQTVAESPVAAEMPPEQQSCVLHSALVKDDLLLMASDMARTPPAGSSVSLVLQCGSREEIETYFRNLSEGGQITHPLGDSFWGSTFGHLTDRFGIQWMLDQPH